VSDPERIAADLRAEVDELDGLLRTLAPADWERETAKLQSEGFVIETKPHGKMQRNPRGPVVKALEDSLLKAEKCLGFAPSERVRIRGERFSDPENDPLDEFRPKNPILERMNKSKRKTKDQ